VRAQLKGLMDFIILKYLVVIYMPAKITMQVLRHSYHPSMQTQGVSPTLNAQRAPIPRSTNESGGLNNMGMINRVRFAKAGCSSCGGVK
jgi:hypothetical protein